MNTSSIAIGVCLSDEHALDIEAFAAACGTEAAFVRLLVEEGLLAPASSSPHGASAARNSPVCGASAACSATSRPICRAWP